MIAFSVSSAEVRITILDGKAGLSSSITRDQQFRGLSTVEKIGGENAGAINTMMSSKIAIQFAYAFVIGIRNHDGSTTARGFLNC
jgi:hypothetical protein